MLTTNLQTAPYLPRQRSFPVDSSKLGVELDKAYIETAQRVNDRTIGIFAINFPVITGEAWYLQGQPRKQQGLRQVYSFTSTAALPHGIDFSQIDRFIRVEGVYNDNGHVYAFTSGNIAVAGQVSINLDITNINFLVGAGAPTLLRGTIILEWLSLTDTNS